MPGDTGGKTFIEHFQEKKELKTALVESLGAPQ